MKIGLVVGHSKTFRGAKSDNVGTEYHFWKKVVPEIRSMNHELYYYRKEANKELCKKFVKDEIELVVEFHFNSFHDDSVKGAEVLAHEADDEAIRIADLFLKFFCSLSRQRDRGCKEINYSDRGGKILGRYADYGIPAFIFEPAFKNEALLVDRKKLIKLIAKSLDIL